MPDIEAYVPRAGKLVSNVLDTIQTEGRYDLTENGMVPYLRLYKYPGSSGMALQYGHIDKSILPKEGCSFLRDQVFKPCGEIGHQDYIGGEGGSLIRCLEACLKKEIEHLEEFSQTDRRINTNNMVFVAGLKFVKIPKNQ